MIHPAIPLSQPEHNEGPLCGLGTEHECPYRRSCVGFAPHQGDPTTAEYLIILEALGKYEAKGGLPALGPTGAELNRFLRLAGLERDSNRVCLVNTTCCRPIEWVPCRCGDSYMRENEVCSECHGLGEYPARQGNGDFINQTPSSGQVHECSSRYLEPVLAAFNGKYIICLGATALAYMMGRPLAMQDYRGTPFVPGEAKPCPECNGEAMVAGRRVKCKHCKGRGSLKCWECGRATKHLKSCAYWETDIERFPACETCAETGTTSGTKVKCKHCKGRGQDPADRGRKHVCAKLKQHQVLWATYHPAALATEPKYRSVVQQDFRRIPQIDEMLEANLETGYDRTLTEEGRTLMLAAHEVAVDIENPKGPITCIGLTDRPKRAWVAGPNGADRAFVEEILRTKQIVGQNYFLHDLWYLHQEGYPRHEDRVHDTRLAGKLLNPDAPNNIVYLAGLYADPPMPGYWKAEDDYRGDLEGVAGGDVDANVRVLAGERRELQERGTWGLYDNYLRPLAALAFRLRLAGMRMDRDRMVAKRKHLLAQVERCRAVMPFTNENCSQQIMDWLYKDLGLEVKRNRKTRRPTADEDARRRLRYELGRDKPQGWEEAQQIIDAVDEAITLSKQCSTFLNYDLSEGDRVHPILTLAGSTVGKRKIDDGAGTFRFSSANPNAQQVPKCECKPKCKGLNALCKGTRHLFIPDEEGWEFISIDLKQAEVVGFLWNAEEWSLLDKILNHGFDAYEVIAAKLQRGGRDQAKTTTLAKIYGEQHWVTAMRLGLSLQETKALDAAFDDLIPGAKRYRMELVALAQKQGYVESPIGYRWYFQPKHHKGREANALCNRPTQSIPPTVIGEAMLGMERELPAPARIAMQLHDEVLLMSPKHLSAQTIECALAWLRRPFRAMPARPIGMGTGLVFNVDVEVGDTWGTMEEVEWQQRG